MTPLVVTLACWWALELVLFARDVIRRKGRLRRDRGTRAVITLSLAGSLLAGTFVRERVPALATPVPVAFAAAGIAVIWAGLAVRVWAVATLGGSFRTSVEVDAGQAVVTGGPYRWVRHPSYTGLLLIAIGCGLAAGNWLSLAVCAVVPLLGLLPRIAVEEAEMVRVLGEPYRRYRATTRRLIPGVW